MTVPYRPPAPIFSHLHKNLWIVGNWEGVEEVAKRVTHQKESVHVTSPHMQIEGKYPCLISIVMTDTGQARVMSVITDTTMRHALMELDKMVRP